LIIFSTVYKELASNVLLLLLLPLLLSPLKTRFTSPTTSAQTGSLNEAV
jgi:hypothetical protein